MNPTIKILLIFFLVFPLLLLSYQIGTPTISKTKASVGEYLNEPAFEPKEIKTIKTAPKENLPFKKNSWQEIEISAKSALAYDFKEDFFLYEKNIHDKRPIASLTKLITAAITIDYSKLDETVYISERAISAEGNSGLLKKGEVLTVRDLLAASLLESSNDAAYALAEYTGKKIVSNSGAKKDPVLYFVSIMNQKFNDLGLANSNFTDPSGLEDSKSFSTAYDFASFIKYLRNNQNYDIIWEILKLKTYNTKSNLSYHEFESTNSLLDEIDGVIGGKTGYTNNALGNLLLVLRGPNDTEIIYLIMGSEDRFGEMRKIIDWVNGNWEWPNNI